MVELKNKPMKDRAKLKLRLPALPLDLNLARAAQLLSWPAMPGQHQTLPGSAVTPAIAKGTSDHLAEFQGTSAGPGTPTPLKHAVKVQLSCQQLQVKQTSQTALKPQCSASNFPLPHLCLSLSSQREHSGLAFFFLMTNLIQISFCQAWLSFDQKKHKRKLLLLLRARAWAGQAQHSV